MKNIIRLCLASACIFFCSMTHAQTDIDGNYPNNRQPLVQKEYMALPIGAIRPEGWLKEQLIRMKNGLTGHLDKEYEAVMGERNGWLGGDGDVWERGPYWIDGLLPLAYILNDRELIEKVQPWVEWVLQSQQENGFFGPDTDRENEPGLQRDNAKDWWPRMVVLKFMQQYYMATQDERVIPFLTRYFHYQLAELPKSPLGKWTFWGEQRGGDNLMVVYWLYNQTGDSFLLDLAELIHQQTVDWANVFTNTGWLNRPLSLHCVNLGQGFKEPAIYYQQSKDPRYLEALDKAVEQIRPGIGLPTGLWGGDELLRFGSPVTGSELCTAIEMMFSLESILEVTGNAKWADYLERVAYNALPTQITDDFSARQYYQQVNQVNITRQWREFSTPHDDTDILFGTLTGYACCTSNMHQGWPKFVQNLWYATRDQGVAALVYAPSTVNVRVADGVSACITENTGYPFKEEIQFTFSYEDKKQKEAYFPFHFRVPGWCKNPKVKLNGEVIPVDACQGEMARIIRTWEKGDVLSITFPMEVFASQWYEGGACVERGPLVYALKMEENWEKKEMEPERQNTYGDWYYEVTSPTPWNYALPNHVFQAKWVADKITVHVKDWDGTTYPWNPEQAPVSLTLKARRLNDWTLVRGSAGPIAYYTQQGYDLGAEESIVLIPYGCTTLRIAEFPVRQY